MAAAEIKLNVKPTPTRTPNPPVPNLFEISEKRPPHPKKAHIKSTFQIILPRFVLYLTNTQHGQKATTNEAMIPAPQVAKIIHVLNKAIPLSITAAHTSKP